MKIVIDRQGFTKIKSVSFSPEVDIIGSEMPINQFTAEIITDHDIRVGAYASLYYKNNVLWAKYWIVEAERYSKDVVTIVCRSDLLLLDRYTLPAKIYENESAKSILQTIFSECHVAVLIDAALTDKQISGYCPKQSAKERVQQVCFVIGAYIQSFFTSTTKILPISVRTNAIPLDKTYMRPSVKYNDYVTAVQIQGYSYVEGTPASTDEYVKIDVEESGTTTTKFYIQTSETIELRNTNVPEDEVIPENIVKIDNVKIINSNNISEILTRIAEYYFMRTTLSADIIDDGEYVPGQRCTIDTGIDNVITGYIYSASFSFGGFAKAKITVKQAFEEKAKTLTIIYIRETEQVAENVYKLPAGYEYNIKNPYLDITDIVNMIRYIYYPFNENVTGIMPDRNATVSESVGIALKFQNEILTILNVDDTLQEDDDEVYIL